MNEALEFLQQQVGKRGLQSPSPLMRWLDPVLLLAEEGRLSFQYLIRPEMTNVLGTLHGGISAAILDDATGATVFSLGEPYYYTTINNVIDYFSTAAAGDTIIADTIIIKKGRQFIHVQCEIWNADKSRMLAKGHSNLVKTNKEK